MVRGDAPIRSHDLKTSISCLNGRVKGIRKLKLDQNKVNASLREMDEWSGSWTSSGSSSISWRECRASSFSTDQLTGADGLPHSAGDIWRSAQLSLVECSSPDQCGRVRAVTKPSRWLMWDDGAVCSQGWTRAWEKARGVGFSCRNCQEAVGRLRRPVGGS